MAGAAQSWGANLASDGRAERIPALQVTGALFGRPRRLARRWTCHPGRRRRGRGEATVVVISHGPWTRRFGEDAGIVGRRVQLNGEPFTVVGSDAAPRFRLAPFWQTRCRVWCRWCSDPGGDPIAAAIPAPVRAAGRWRLRWRRHEARWLLSPHGSARVSGHQRGPDHRRDDARRESRPGNARRCRAGAVSPWRAPRCSSRAPTSRH